MRWGALVANCAQRKANRDGKLFAKKAKLSIAQLGKVILEDVLNGILKTKLECRGWLAVQGLDHIFLH